MANPTKGRFRSLSIVVLRKFIVLIGCLLFSCSVIFPFYSLQRTGFNVRSTTRYWSFKSFSFEVRYRFDPIPEDGMSRTFLDYWFSDFWFHEKFITDSGHSWVFVLLFTIQISALVTRLASVLVNRKILALVPIALCSTVTTLMIYVDSGHSRNTTWTNYETGYWLTYPSLLMFLIAFITNLTTRKKQKKNP